jgi:adenosine kinase
MRFSGRFGDHILPEATHRISVAFLVDEVERRRGGTGANICYTLALLGEQPLLCAAAGADADDYCAALAALGVDVSPVLRCGDVGTATAFITTDSANNQITAFFAGAMNRADGVSLSGLDDVSHVVVAADGSAGMHRHCREAAELGAHLLFAPAQQIPALSDEQLRFGLEAAWCVMGNEYEVALIEERTGISIDELSRRRIVIRTRGAEGSEIHTTDGIAEIAAAPVRVVADPTGAGDAYIAGFLHGVHRGLLPSAAAQLGSVAAAWCVERPGPQGHTFTPAEFAARYAEVYGEPLPAA